MKTVSNSTAGDDFSTSGGLNVVQRSFLVQFFDLANVSSLLVRQIERLFEELCPN